MELAQSPALVEGHSTFIPRDYVLIFRRKDVPKDVMEMLAERCQQLVFDGFTAGLSTENPYSYDVNVAVTERAAHVLWNRGRAYRAAGNSLKSALLISET